MKYQVVRGCAWKDFSAYGMEGQQIDAADLKTSDGKPLPSDVVQLFVGKGNLKPVAADTPPPADPPKG